MQTHDIPRTRRAFLHDPVTIRRHHARRQNERSTQIARLLNQCQPDQPRTQPRTSGASVLQRRPTPRAQRCRGIERLTATPEVRSDLRLLPQSLPELLPFRGERTYARRVGGGTCGLKQRQPSRGASRSPREVPGCTRVLEPTFGDTPANGVSARLGTPAPREFSEQITRFGRVVTRPAASVSHGVLRYPLSENSRAAGTWRRSRRRSTRRTRW